MNKKRVVITGIGPLASPGIGKDKFWQGLLQGKTGLKLEECFIGGELWEKFYLHKLENFDINKFGLDENSLDQMKVWKEGEEVTDLYFLIAALKLALDDSGLTVDPDDNTMSCIVTHENPGLEQYFNKIIDIAYDVLKNNKDISKKGFAEELHRRSIKSSFDLQTFMALFHVMKAFGIHGYSLYTNNACASGIYSIETASQIIKCGRNDVVVLVAADCPRIYKYLWFRDLNMYAKDGKMKPFAKDANGFVLGDGAVGIVLEDFEHARKRNAKIYAEYLGGGFSQEGWKVTVPMAGSDSYPKAIKEALQFSGIEKDEIDLACLHGASNLGIDRYEAKALTDVFGENPQKPLITTFKPYIGHNLGGSALLETAILLLCLDNNVILPVLNTKEVAPKTKIDIVKEKVNKKLRTVLKTCCAFAGFNAAAVFRKIDS